MDCHCVVLLIAVLVLLTGIQFTSAQSSTTILEGGIEISNGVTLITPYMYILTLSGNDACLTWVNDTIIEMQACTINSTQLFMQRTTGSWESVYRPNRCIELPKKNGDEVFLANCTTDGSLSQSFLPRLLISTANSGVKCVGPCNTNNFINSSVCMETPKSASWCVARAHTFENSEMWPVRYMDLALSSGIWLEVGSSGCSVSYCGWGYRNITYICRNKNGYPPNGFINSYCDINQKPADSIGGSPCVDEACPPEDGEWSDWTECSEECGPGIKQRSCSPSPMYGGLPCEGNDTEICIVTPCPVDGNYTGWSNCSTTCGPGVQRRTCTNPVPAYGGKNCTALGLGPAERPCSPPNKEKCPNIDGGFTEWSVCSATCGVGTQLRSCSNPKPSGDGKKCIGPVIRVCDTEQPCPVVPSVEKVPTQSMGVTVGVQVPSQTAIGEPTFPFEVSPTFLLPSSEVATENLVDIPPGFPPIDTPDSNTVPPDGPDTVFEPSVNVPDFEFTNPFDVMTLRSVAITTEAVYTASRRRREETARKALVTDFPNGTFVGSDGTVIFSNGIKRYPNNTIIVPENPGGNYTITQKLVTFPNGSVKMTDTGRVIITIPYSEKDASGIISYSTLPITLFPHTVIVPNGVVMYPNGTVFDPTIPSQKVSKITSKYSKPAATMIIPSSKPSNNGKHPYIPRPNKPKNHPVNSTKRPITTPWVFPDGAIFYPNGSLRLPNGNLVYANGTVTVATKKQLNVSSVQTSILLRDHGTIKPWAIAIIVLVCVFVLITIVVVVALTYRSSLYRKTDKQIYRSTFGNNPTDISNPSCKADKLKMEVNMGPMNMETDKEDGFVDVTFQLACIDVKTEEYMAVIGNVPRLGGWSISEAPCMHSLGEGRYKLIVRIPKNTQVLYRFVKISPANYKAVYMGKEKMIVEVGEEDLELNSAIW